MMMMETILMMWMDHAVDVCVCVVCVRDIKSGICMVHVILLKGAKGGFGGYRWTYLKGRLSCCQIQIFPPCQFSIFLTRRFSIFTLSIQYLLTL